MPCHKGSNNFLKITCFVDQPGFQVRQRHDVVKGLDERYVVGPAKLEAVILEVSEIRERKANFR
jgi:hypothetical protein